MRAASGPEIPLSERESHDATGGAGELSLAWVFPEAGQAPVSLTWDGSSDQRRELCFGRDPTCDVCIVSKQVSRRHAVITQGSAGRARITDLESRNGTRVNGRRVATAELEAGDVIRLGGWVGVVTKSPSHFEELGPGLFGGATLQTALAALRARAESPVPVVIEGETGTGKETAAKSLHAWSGRTGSFVSVNCSAVPKARIEAELFGYEAGAFPGADQPSPGQLRSAHGGTLVLDQIASLSLCVQAKLLDALTRQTVEPLGSQAFGEAEPPPEPVPVDVRIIVIAQEPLISAVREGSLRQDVLAHFHSTGVNVRLPPLRQRREDIAGIFLHQLRTLTDRQRDLEVSPDLIEKLCLHTWPFNVRELVGLTRRLVTLHAGEALLSEKHLPDRFTAVATDPFPADERKTT